MLTPERLPELQRAIADAGFDGWLLFDFHHVNPIAAGLLRLQGMTTRRVFAYVPREGTPVAITHAIEQGAWVRWPAAWTRERYSSWRTLEDLLARHVAGKRVAMEYSPGDAVPYLDRIPAGVLEMVRAAGAEVASSAPLVSRFFAAWNADHLASHRRAARRIAAVARSAFDYAAQQAVGGAPVSEYDLQQWIADRFRDERLLTTDAPIVAVGANAANPHYEPTHSASRSIEQGDIVLIDLWAREAEGPYADQTWVASLGVPAQAALEMWAAVRDARDAAIALLKERIGARREVRGGEVDDAARAVITTRGYGEYFPHRTGHSIDPLNLHGAGPHLDNLETREDRVLVPGVAFSIEPGIYVPGEMGMRTEVNAFIGDGEVIVTPAEYQRELIVV